MVKCRVASQLNDCHSVDYVDASGLKQHAPLGPLLNNIPLLHHFLEDIVDEWRRTTAPHTDAANAQFKNGGLTIGALAPFESLQCHFLRSLFSYAFFFVACLGAYDKVYGQLGAAKRQHGLRIRPRKQPKLSAYIRKVVQIRDMSITHMPSDRTEPIDAWAAIMWQPLTLSFPSAGPLNFEDMEFSPGPFTVTYPDGTQRRTPDLTIRNLSEVHRECMPHLERYDRVCVEYLGLIKQALSSGSP